MENTTLITGITSTPLLHTIRDVICQEAELSSVIGTALRQAIEIITLEGNKVTVALDDQLLHHDILITDQELSQADVWDYVQFRAQQQWGERNKILSTFVQVQSPQSNYYHIIFCPTKIINILKLSIAELGATPLWLGTYVTSLLYRDLTSPATIVFANRNYYTIYHRGRKRIVSGKIRFVTGKAKIIATLGNRDDLKKLFTDTTDRKDLISFQIVDNLSETKKTHWQAFEHKFLVPFEGINIEGIQSPKEISVRELNILTAIIRGQAPEYSINLFDVEAIHEVPSIPKEIQRKTLISQEPKNLMERKKGARKKIYSRNFLNTFVTIVIISFCAFIIYFMLEEPAFETTMPEKVQITGDEKEMPTEIQSPYPAKIIHAIDESYTRLNTIERVFLTIDIDSLLKLSINNMVLHVEWVGKDSFDRSSILTTGRITLDQSEINCCGGIMQTIDARLAIINGPIMHSWNDLNHILMKLADSLSTVQFRKLKPITTQTISYRPVVMQVTQIEEIQNAVRLLRSSADNLIVRKIVITNNPAKPLLSAIFYVSILSSYNGLG